MSRYVAWSSFSVVRFLFLTCIRRHCLLDLARTRLVLQSPSGALHARSRPELLHRMLGLGCAQTYLLWSGSSDGLVDPSFTSHLASRVTWGRNCYWLRGCHPNCKETTRGTDKNRSWSKFGPTETAQEWSVRTRSGPQAVDGQVL